MDNSLHATNITEQSENIAGGQSPVFRFRPLNLSLSRIDARSIRAAIVCFVVYALLAAASLELSRFQSQLATVWLPNAAMVAFLLRKQVSNELPILAAIWCGSFIGNATAGFSNNALAIYSTANVVDVILIVGLMRNHCDTKPNMLDIDHLSRFILAGGIIGPGVAALIAATSMGFDLASAWGVLSGWFLTDSMGMLLLVPTALMIYDAVEQRKFASGRVFIERGILIVGGLVASQLVFYQTTYPLLFLIPLLTLFFAFRVGGIGTAIFVLSLAGLVSWASYLGLGPIALASSSAVVKVHLIQCFLAANFLAGLPVAATLKGRDTITKKRDRALRERALLADNITDAVFRYNLEGECTYASPSVRTVLDEEPATFIGRRASYRMHEDAKQRIVRAEQRLLEGESQNERFTYRRFKDDGKGKPVYVEADCAIACDADTGLPEAIIVSARDVTDRVELELLLTRARRHAENAARAKSEFLANMSHEIRTPMNGVLGFTELMLQSELEPEQRRHAELIAQSGRSMMLLLNDILDLSKIDAGHIGIENRPIQLFSAIDECVSLHRAAAEGKGLAIDVTAEVEAEWVLTDGLRLRQIILNLIGNAVKFTERGAVRILLKAQGEKISISVEDSGVGIDDGRLDHVFNPFTQAESDTARRYGGTGLGLSISQKLAHLLGGEITVESTLGYGSRFTLTLPLVPAKNSALLSAEGAAHQSQDRKQADFTKDELATHLVPSRILLAEDYDVNRILLTDMVERCGQSVSCAHDGSEAIMMVLDAAVRGEPYDLVLMDIQMPNCDGYTATRTIREEGIDAETLPIVAITANAFPEDVAAARDAGMQAHLAKPVVFGELAKTLWRFLPHNDFGGAPEGRLEVSSGTDDERSGEPAGVDAEYSTDTKSAGTTIRPGNGEAAKGRALLKERWEFRRSEAITALEQALSKGPIGGSAASDLASLMHKLAGTAGMFDEAELGDKAAALERALKARVDDARQTELAQDILAAAAKRPAAPDR